MMEPTQEPATYAARITEYIASVQESIPLVPDHWLSDKNLVTILQDVRNVLPSFNYDYSSENTRLPLLGYWGHSDGDKVHEAYVNCCTAVNVAAVALADKDIRAGINKLKRNLSDIAEKVVGEKCPVVEFLTRHEATVADYPLLGVAPLRGQRPSEFHTTSQKPDRYELTSPALPENGINVPTIGWNRNSFNPRELQQAYLLHLHGTVGLLENARLSLALLATKNSKSPDLYSSPIYPEANEKVACNIIIGAEGALWDRCIEVAESLDKAFLGSGEYEGRKREIASPQEQLARLKSTASDLGKRIENADATFKFLTHNVGTMRAIATSANRMREQKSS